MPKTNKSLDKLIDSLNANSASNLKNIESISNDISSLKDLLIEDRRLNAKLRRPRSSENKNTKINTDESDEIRSKRKKIDSEIQSLLNEEKYQEKADKKKQDEDSTFYSRTGDSELRSGNLVSGLLFSFLGRNEKKQEEQKKQLNSDERKKRLEYLENEKIANTEERKSKTKTSPQSPNDNNTNTEKIQTKISPVVIQKPSETAVTEDPSVLDEKYAQRDKEIASPTPIVIQNIIDPVTVEISKISKECLADLKRLLESIEFKTSGGAGGFPGGFPGGTPFPPIPPVVWPALAAAAVVAVGLYSTKVAIDNVGESEKVSKQIQDKLVQDEIKKINDGTSTLESITEVIKKAGEASRAPSRDLAVVAGMGDQSSVFTNMNNEAEYEEDDKEKTRIRLLKAKLKITDTKDAPTQLLKDYIADQEKTLETENKKGFFDTSKKSSGARKRLENELAYNKSVLSGRTDINESAEKTPEPKLAVPGATPTPAPAPPKPQPVVPDTSPKPPESKPDPKKSFPAQIPGVIGKFQRESSDPFFDPTADTNVEISKISREALDDLEALFTGRPTQIIVSPAPVKDDTKPTTGSTTPSSPPSKPPPTSPPPGGGRTYTPEELISSGVRLRQTPAGVVAGDVQIPGAYLDTNLVELSKQLPTIIDSATNLADVPKIPLKFVSISGLNDAFHQINKPNSEHTKGKAVDFTLNRKPTVEEGEKLVALLQTGGKFSKVIDEYNHPSVGAIGDGHIHAEVSGTSTEQSTNTPAAESISKPPKVESIVGNLPSWGYKPPGNNTADASLDRNKELKALENPAPQSIIPKKVPPPDTVTKETYKSGIITGFNPRDYKSEIDKMIPELQEQYPFHSQSELRRKAVDKIERNIVTGAMIPQGTTAVQSDSGPMPTQLAPTSIETANNNSGVKQYNAATENKDLNTTTNTGATIVNAPQTTVVNNQNASNKQVREQAADTSNIFQSIYNRLSYV